MKGWNYRVIQAEKDGLPYAYVAEVYYNDDGKAIGHTQSDANHLIGEDAVEVQAYYLMIAEAFLKPVLNESELPEADDFAVIAASIEEEDEA